MKLSNQLERIVRLLDSEEPGSEKYDKLLSTISAISYIIKDTGDIEFDTVASTVEAKPAVAPMPAVTPFPDETPFDAPKNSTTPSIPDAVEKPEELTVEYVRGLLTNVSQHGVAVQPLVMKYVPEGKDIKFSSIPKSKYPELVEELKTYAK